MNVSELARILKVTPNELRETLPEIGFDIGQKAIKIDKKIAQKILKDWGRLSRQLKEKKDKEERERQEALKEAGGEEKKNVKISSYITVKNFSDVSGVPVNKILKELMKNGVFASMNEKIDFDTASVIGEDLGLEVELLEVEDENSQKIDQSQKLKNILEKEENLSTRAPVIVVMGHVDHGKTSLLDTIRKSNVIDGESGGITQHIGAYQIKKDGHSVTFIDTPGHEAFTAMRGRGAKVADVAILVVAADDGVKPQTTEAYRIIEASKLPFVVAINKIDKEGADINRVKQELSSKLNILPEDWGGKITCVPVSALKDENIGELLDMVLLTAQTKTEEMLANADSQAVGTIIESHVNKASGPVATILIQNGTLHLGDQLCFEGTVYGKIKALKNYKGEIVESAEPSEPVEILGLKIAPAVGDILQVGEGKKVKTKKMTPAGSTNNFSSSQTEAENEEISKLNILIKSDVLGSAEAIEESLEKINTKKVKVKIIHKGLGNITEGDIKKAEDLDAKIAGFNVKISPQVESLIREKDVEVKTFNIIYDLIEYVREEMKKIVKTEYKRVDIGRLKILEVFRSEANSQILGGKVLDGYLENSENVEIEVLRGGENIDKGSIEKLKRGKEEVKQVEENNECGIKYIGKPIVEKGDILQFFKTEEVKGEL